MKNNKQQSPVVVKQHTGVAINTENLSPELINYLTPKSDNENDYFNNLLISTKIFCCSLS